ncbi:MAG: threonylcarbamoyl-AMP synthase [Clostridia bacterium]|nr:threonylcarbamoyl-AMP synthase [Clostridia bacterium]
MQTKIYTLSPEDTQHPFLDEAAYILKHGGLVAFPTETVYGLGGSATDSQAAQKIYAAKGRPSDNPLIIHVADPEDASIYAHVNETYQKLAEAFMPGPLTVILPKRDIIPETVTGGLDTVAVRCPSHPLARALIRRAGIAIAAPSANLSGSPSPTSGDHVIRDLSGRIDAIIDGGSSEIGLESTIIKLDGSHATLLRPGAITVDALRCVCEEVTVSPAIKASLAEGERPLSPGMKYKHYAPSSPLVLIDGDENAVLAFFKQAQENESCAILCYREEVSALRNENLIDIGERENLSEQAHNLFSALRQTESMDVRIIYAHLPPEDGLGLALYNRLIRAAAHTVRRV